LARYENANTQRVVNHNLKHFILFLTANGYTLDTVDQNIINLYLNSLRKKELSNATYNLNASNIKKFLEYQGKKGFDYKTEPTEAYGNTRLVSESGFRNVIRYLEDKKNRAEKKHAKYLRDYILLNVLYLTGLRKNEVIGLKHGDIKLEAGEYFYRARLKRGKEIKKQFPDHLLAGIAELKKAERKGDGDYLFTSKYTAGKNRLSHRALNKILNTYYQKINKTSETVTVHSIRNLSGFKVYQITKDIIKTQNHLNHAHLNTTQIYLEKLQSKKIDYYSEMAGALN
jgi:integrase/recombinase XerC